MKELVELINEKCMRYKNELFYLNGEFFAMYDGKIAKLADDRQSYEATYMISGSTYRFINNYCDLGSLDLEAFADALSYYIDDFEGYDENDDFTDLTADMDTDISDYVYACIDKAISPSKAIRAAMLMAGGCESGVWYMDHGNGEYSGIIDTIAKESEVIDFEYTTPDDDEYWRSIVEEIAGYIYDIGEVL